MSLKILLVKAKNLHYNIGNSLKYLPQYEFDIILLENCNLKNLKIKQQMRFPNFLEVTLSSLIFNTFNKFLDVRQIKKFLKEK